MTRPADDSLDGMHVQGDRNRWCITVKPANLGSAVAGFDFEVEVEAAPKGFDTLTSLYFSRNEMRNLGEAMLEALREWPIE